MSSQQLLSVPSFYTQTLPLCDSAILAANTSNQTFTWASLGLGFEQIPAAVVAVNNDPNWATYGVSVVSFTQTNVVLKQLVPSGLTAEIFGVRLIIFP